MWPYIVMFGLGLLCSIANAVLILVAIAYGEYRHEKRIGRRLT